MFSSPAHSSSATRASARRRLAAGSGLVAYRTVTASDEYRTLFYDTVYLDWQLAGLDGSVEYFLPTTAGSSAGRHGAAGSRKVQLQAVTGECPACGMTANPSFAYADANNPLLPTTVTDGRGTPTSFTYDGNGRRLTEIATVQTSRELPAVSVRPGPGTKPVGCCRHCAARGAPPESPACRRTSRPRLPPEGEEHRKPEPPPIPGFYCSPGSPQARLNRAIRLRCRSLNH